MNKLGYQPLSVIMKAEPSDSGWPSNSAKLLRVAAALGALFVLCGVAAVCLAGFGLLTPGTTGTKQSPEIRVVPTATPALVPDQEAGVGVSIPETKQPQPLTGTGSSDDAMVVQSPTPAPISVPASASPAPAAPAIASDRSSLPEARRKSLEKTRRAAERRRSRLEANYKKHAISSEAYREGVKTYQAEIERYRNGINPAKGPKNEAGF